MARNINRLSARKAATRTKVGRHADGGNLYLSISANGGRRWVFLYRRKGRLREMGLGSAKTVPLAKARAAAADARQLLVHDLDPLATRQAAVGEMSFKECAAAYIEAHRSGWRNAKHASQWENTLERYAYPTIGSLPVADVGVQHVTKIIEPIWATKTETASRIRGRIESILDWAKARSYRTGENPARWRGHLENLLPKRSKVQKVKHHAALPYVEVASFMANLRKRDGIAALALELLILTATRTAEVMLARWSEFDLQARTWTIPAQRIKGGITHRIPLSSPALAVLRKMAEFKSDDGDPLVFPSGEAAKSFSNNALLALLKRMKRSDLTAHGFRSTFRDWAAETTNFPNEVVEMALAHTIKNKAEAAYRRGDMLDRRRALMTAWASYCDRIRSGNVVSISQKTKQRSSR